MRRVFVGIFVLFAALVSRPVMANTLELAATFNNVDICAADNNVGCTWGTILLDTDPTLGTLALADTTIGGVFVSGSLHTADAGTFNILSSSSLTIRNDNAGIVDLIAAISATDFLGPVTEAFVTGSGTWTTAAGSTIDLSWYNDPANGQGGETPTDTPGTQLSTFSDTAVGAIDSFSHNAGPIAIFDPSGFSMTLGVSMSLTPGGSLISRGQSEVKIQQETPVPEPGSMFLLGSGMIGLAMMAKRHRRRQLAK